MTYEIARNWRLKDQRYRLEGEICNGCEQAIFPPRDVCPHCGTNSQRKVELSGKGEVYSSTIIYEAPEGFADGTPYEVALIKLEEGPMLTAQITDKEDATKVTTIGTKVEMVTRKLKEDGDKGLIQYGYKFRVPVEST